MNTNFAHIIGDNASVSLAGICKNAGKTTVLNKIIKDFDRQKTTLGITSIGRDGENVDVVTGTKKPGIYVRKGTIIATAASLLTSCDITKEILAKTEIATPLGEIVLIRALSDGNVQIAGPSMNKQLTKIRKSLLEFGAEKVLMDGAISRKSLCSPEVAESVILCSGASYDKNMEAVIAHTKYVSDIFRIQALENRYIRNEIIRNEITGDEITRNERTSDEITGNERTRNEIVGNKRTKNQITGKQEAGKFLLISKQGESMVLSAEENLLSSLRTEKYGDIEYIYINGAFSDMMIKPLLMSDVYLKDIQFIVKDSSCIMLRKENYEKLSSKGAAIRVLQPIRLLAIAVNPFSAYGYDFNKQEFKEKISDAISGVPVLNVMELVS